MPPSDRRDERIPGDRAPAPPAGWRRLVDIERRPGALFVYSLVGAVVCFWRLGAIGLVSMEGMTFDTARLMMGTGDWIVPRLYGEIYSYKPALAYWLGSIPLWLSGEPSEALLRLPFAASGFAMGLAVLLLVGRLAGWRGGLLSAIASTTGVLFLQKSRMAEFDIVLAACVGVAVAAACCNLAAERPTWRLWLLAYVALAAGFLAKGVPALVAFGPGILAGGLAAGRFRRLFGWRHITAVLLFVAICGSYLWAAWETAGPAAFAQPIEESQVRGFSWLKRTGAEVEESADRRWIAEQNDSYGKGWVRAVALAAVKPLSIWSAFLPWSLVLLYPLLRGRARSGGRDAGRDTDRGAEPAPPLLDPLTRCAAGFLAAGTLMFMLVPTHEMRYYLPLCAPAGILCGLLADRLLEGDRPRVRRLLVVAIGVAALFAVATTVLALRYTTPPIPAANRLVMAAAGGLGLVASLYLLRRRGRYRLVAALGIAALCAMLTQYLGVEPYRAAKRDLRPEAAELSRHLPAGETVWVPGPAGRAGKHASLFYYLDRPIRAFRPEALPASGSYCLVTGRDLEELAGAPGFRFREIARAEHVWFSYRLGICQ